MAATLVLGAAGAAANSLEHGSSGTFSDASHAAVGNAFSVQLGSYGAPPRIRQSVVSSDRGRVPARRAAARRAAARRRRHGRRRLPAVVSRPRIDGAPLVGSALRATKGNWKNDPSTDTYQWLTSPSAGRWVAIPGATSPSYTLSSEDLGRQVTVMVTAKNVAGSSQAKASPTRRVTASAMPVDKTLPTIIGRPATGASLLATAGTWTNKPTSYVYQWWEGTPLGTWIAVAGATGPSFTPNPLNVGDLLSVIVTARNAVGATSATATPTSSVTTSALALSAPENTSVPQITGTAEVGDQLSATAGTWTNSPSSETYQWNDCGAGGGACTAIGGATSTSYTVGSGDVGDTIDVTVTSTNAAGSAAATSSPTSQVVAPPPSAPENMSVPQVTGTAQVGDQLSASEGTWTNGPSSFAYQWEDCNAAGGSCTPISGATGSSYTLASGSLGSAVVVAVTATNAGGSATVTSSPTSAVTEPPPVVNAPANTSVPQVSGTAQVGDELTASTGSWSGSPSGFAYQWSDCNSGGSSCSSISGATSSGYTVGSSDVGHGIEVTVTATNAGGSTSATSAPTATVADPPPPPSAPANTSLPTISGTAQQGDTLTASQGSWSGSPTSYRYQWSDCNSSGGNCAGINGANAGNYKLALTDVGSTLEVTVTATNAEGSTSATSAPTATVSNPPPPPAPANTSLPTISGTAAQGDKLTASNGSWSGSPASYGYQWEDCNSSGAACAAISGATSSTYTLATSDIGSTVVVVVTAVNSGGSASAASTPTAVVIGPPPVNTTAPAVSGTATQGQTLSTTNGSWSGSPTSYSYRWERCNSSGSGCSAISGATSSTYTLAAADVGSTTVAVVTATNAGGSASASSSATAVITAIAPVNTAAPTISGTTTQGQTLATSNGTWSNSPTSYGYQWKDCNSSGAACTAIAGATASTYTLAASDVGDTIVATVTGTNSGGNASASSAATSTIAAQPTGSAPSNTASPVIDGATLQGDTLSATPGTWANSPASYTYQWQDCAASGGSCSNISGATSSTYAIQNTDVAHTIQVLVTAHNSAGASSPAASSGTGSPSWNASGPTPVVLGPTSPTWQASYDGSPGSWGAGSNGCDNFEGDSSYTGWWGFDGNASGSNSGGYIGGFGWGAAAPSSATRYFSFTNGSSASSPAFSGQAANLYVDSGATTSGEVDQRSDLEQCPIDPAGSIPVDDSASGAYQGNSAWYRFEVYFPSDYAPVAGTSFNWVYEFHNYPNDGTCCANVSAGVVTDTEDGGPASSTGRFSLRILGGGSPSNPIPPGTNMGSASVAPTYGGAVSWLKGPTLTLSHWYDVLLHVNWNYTSSGSLTYYLDGTQVGTYNGPTLYYLKSSSGSVSNDAGPGNDFEMVDNYREMPTPATWNPDSIIHDEDMWGPSETSVGGGP
jgi:hypothetical protein